MAIDAHPRPGGSIRIEVSAAAEHLAGIRHRLATWLGTVGMTDTDIADINLAVNEACTNCIEHAYRDTAAGSILIEAIRNDRQIVIAVADSGTWQDPPGEAGTRGRGLAIMRAVSAGMDLSTSSEGTTVRMTFDAGSQDCGNRTT